MLSQELKDEVRGQCLCKWNAQDDHTQFFEENFDEWIDQIPTNVLSDIVELIKRFEYFSQDKVNGFLDQLHTKLLANDDFDEETSIYTLIPSKKGIDNSSAEYLLNYKYLHRLNKYRVVMDLDTYIEVRQKQYADIKSIVFIDDYCGSGGSFITFVTKHLEQIKDRHLYYVVTYTMTDAVSAIQKHAIENSYQVDVIYINQAGKTFDQYKMSKEPENVREEIRKASKELGIPKKAQLGFENCEALVSFYNDTPNNTIGLFWKDTSVYFSIFPRELENTENMKRPTPSSMKADREKRNKQNYVLRTKGV